MVAAKISHVFNQAARPADKPNKRSRGPPAMDMTLLYITSSHKKLHDITLYYATLHYMTFQQFTLHTYIIYTLCI